MKVPPRRLQHHRKNRGRFQRGVRREFLAKNATGKAEPYVLVTGGAGFIGSNLADRLLSSGTPVLIFDNLSRPGAEKNLEWLSQVHGDRLRVEISDVRNFDAVSRGVRGATAVFHFAAQVAVTSSVENPREDFEINVGGTINVLEAVRARAPQPRLVFTSTNKVYGAMDDLLLTKDDQGYRPVSGQLHASGVDERRSLEFCTPYGCSKGASDQYVLDYARTFGVPATLFRMSCIYGPHQFGTEDQGWVAHFLLCAVARQPITIYGDGLQVRDVLFVEDLVHAFLLAKDSPATCGQAFNIGGGPSNALSLRRLVELISELQGFPCAVRHDEWRCGDQRHYVSDTHKFRNATGWSPRVGVREGVERLWRWLREQSVALRRTGANGNAVSDFERLPLSESAEAPSFRSS
ncbi:MAG TPA: NAD-dependent epimerase/dehydratase family protein [Candidatus Acidoferrales bacterium]|nr:NAD-dependent epimerase/dehydratase family protein [Candidatus Acidoferrales bacterium]